MEDTGGVTEGGEAGRELLGVLLARQRFVECLDERPSTKPELVTDCEVSRSTVDRGIAELEDAGLVRRHRGRYELTLFGEIVAREFGTLFDRMSAFAAVGDLLAALPGDVGLDATLFEQATVRRGGGMGITTALETFAGASEVRIVDPPLPLLHMGLVQDCEQLRGVNQTVLIRGELLAALATHIPDRLVAFERAGNRLQELDDTLPFAFALVERPTGRELCLLLGSGEAGLAVVTTTDSAAIEWGERLYDSLVADAEPLDAETVVTG